jgi:hypothetical protein
VFLSGQRTGRTLSPDFSTKPLFTTWLRKLSSK